LIAPNKEANKLIFETLVSELVNLLP